MEPNMSHAISIGEPRAAFNAFVVATRKPPT